MTHPISNNLLFRGLALALDGLSVRQRATANNIANLDTPGYKAQQVSFEAQLQQALAGGDDAGLPLVTTQPDHLSWGRTTPGSAVTTISRTDNTLRNDGNNVDVDLEMTTLADTTLRYQTLLQLTGSKLAQLKSIIREGR